MRTRSLLIVLFVSMVGCGSASLESEVDTYVASTKAVVHDCGDVVISNVCGSPMGSMPDPARLACLDDCGTRLRLTQYTDEGDPIYTIYVRTPSPSGATCTTAVFVDTRADDFGPKEVTKQRCDYAKAASACAGPTTTACVPL